MQKIRVGNETQNVFFTSDSHFSHHNIIRYCFRPFKDITEMNETIISNWNRVVRPKDIIFHLGDFMFHQEKNTGRQIKETEQMLSRLNGMKYLIVGNHDSSGTTKALGWQGVYDILNVKCFQDQTIILCHYALVVWHKSHHGSFHLFGHSHNTLGKNEDLHSYSGLVGELLTHSRSFDVGVDAWNFTPISFSQVKEEMSKKTFKPVDHHKEDRDE